MSEKMTKVPMIQLFVGFVFVMAVGVVIVIISGPSQEDVKTGQVLLRGMQLTKYGTTQCSKAIREVTGSKVYSPLTTTGDRLTTVTVIWGKGSSMDKKFNKAECTYKKAKGVVSLVIDGKETKISE